MHIRATARARWGGALLVALVCLFASPTRSLADDAEPPVDGFQKQVEHLAARGVEHFRAGKYREALKYFLEAYRLDPVDELLYNIAKVYEALEDWSLASDYYRQYAESEKARPKLRKKALAKLPKIKKKAAEQEARRKAEERKAELLREQAAEARRRAARERKKPKPHWAQGLRTPGWIVLAGAGAALAAGTTFGVFSRQHQDTFSRAHFADEKQDYREKAESRALWADVSFGSAALLGVVGGAMVLLDPGAPKQGSGGDLRPRLNMTPLTSSDTLGVSLQGTF